MKPRSPAGRVVDDHPFAAGALPGIAANLFAEPIDELLRIARCVERVADRIKLHFESPGDGGLGDELN